MYQKFNFLIIGRSGSGKSATTKFLTGDQQIKVMNSPNEVTKTLQFYHSTKRMMENTKIQISVIDIPGLDQLQNRKMIRQLILNEIQTKKIQIDAILYTIDSVARDTVNNKKIFHFLNDLPWSYSDLKKSLYPVLTKYDNLIFDGDDQNIKQTFQEFEKIFQDNNYESSWKNNHVYWINQTKNIQMKMNYNNEIKQIYETQFEKLIRLVRASKSKLTYQKIQTYLIQEAKYIQRKIKNIIRVKQTILRTIKCTLTPSITVQIVSNNQMQNYAAGTLTGLGIILSKTNTNEFLKVLCFVGSIIAGGVLAKNLIKQINYKVKQTHDEKPDLTLKYERNYTIQKVNEIISKKLKEYEQEIAYKIENNTISIKLPARQEFDCFILNKKDIQCSIGNVKLVKNTNQQFIYKLDEQEPRIVTFNINIDLYIKIPQETTLLQLLENHSFNFKQQFDQQYY